MKIVAGMGSIDDYELFAEAGADEVFTGFVPQDYMERFGRFAPLNRREVIFYNVSLGAKEDLKILSRMVKDMGIGCTMAVNAPVYTDNQRAEIRNIVNKAAALGFKDFIVADETLLNNLGDSGVNLHISGEYGEMNSLVLKHLKKYSPKRIIFPRQTEISEMQSMIEGAEGIKEFEAFVLNERCHFTGAYCSSRHCDELCHMCRVPYKVTKGLNQTAAPKEYDNLSGSTGCGLCALWDLQKAGITHLKIVSRGNDSESTRQDILMLKEGLEILNRSDCKEEYIKRMKKELFPGGCSHNCYYPKIVQ